MLRPLVVVLVLGASVAFVARSHAANCIVSDRPPDYATVNAALAGACDGSTAPDTSWIVAVSPPRARSLRLR